MIANQLDLDIAVAEGIISREQALKLLDLSMRDRTGDELSIDFSQDTRDEPFRLLRGFRDFFIAMAIVIFALGLSAIAYEVVGQHGLARTDLVDVGEKFFRAMIASLGLCAFGIALAEFITRRQRLPLSSLVVSIACAIWSALLFALIAGQIAIGIGDDRDAALLIIGWAAVAGAMLSVTLFYWRYRLPFALLLLAGSFVALSILIAKDTMGRDWFSEYGRILFGLWGLLIFGTALWFDGLDRLRVTRFSECAFWLHLIAAPLVVHALLFGGAGEAPGTIFTLVTMLVMGLIALLIDRRALLVSGLTYFGSAIGQVIASSTIFGSQSTAFTLFVLGGIMLVLGLGWTPIRRRVLALLPFDGLKARLPPIGA